MSHPEEQIDWAIMQASETWRYQVMPLLKQMREAMVTRIIVTRDPIELQFLRGQLHAYDDLMTLPERAIARERQQRADAEAARRFQEEIDARRRQSGPAWAHRWANKLRSGTRSG